MLLFNRSPYWMETNELKSVSYGFRAFGTEQLLHRFDQVYQGQPNSEFYCEFSAIVNTPVDTRWIKANVNMTGFYRVHYDKNNWEQLSQQLRLDHTVSNSTPCHATFSVLEYSESSNVHLWGSIKSLL